MGELDGDGRTLLLALTDDETDHVRNELRVVELDPEFVTVADDVLLERVDGELVKLPVAVAESAMDPVTDAVVARETDGEPDRDGDRETNADAVALLVLLVDFVPATETVVDADDVEDSDPDTDDVNDTEKDDVRDVRQDVVADTVDDGDGVTLLDPPTLFDAKFDADDDTDAVVLKETVFVARTERDAAVVAVALGLKVRVTVMRAELDMRDVDVALAVDDAVLVLDMERVGVTDDVDDLLAEFDAETVRVTAPEGVMTVADGEKLTRCDGVPMRDGTSDLDGAPDGVIVTLLVTVGVTRDVRDAEMLGVGVRLPAALGDTDRVLTPDGVAVDVDDAVRVPEPDAVDVLVADTVFVDDADVDKEDDADGDGVRRGVIVSDLVLTADLETADGVPDRVRKTVAVVAPDAVIVLFVVAELVAIGEAECTGETLCVRVTAALGVGAFEAVAVLLLDADADTDFVDDDVGDAISVFTALFVVLGDAVNVDEPVTVLDDDEEREGGGDAVAEGLVPDEREMDADADAERVGMADALLSRVARDDAVLVGDALPRDDGSGVRVAVVVRVDVDEIPADLDAVAVRESVFVDDGDGDAVVVLLDVRDPDTVRDDVDERVDVFDADAEDVGAIAGPAAARRRRGRVGGTDSAGSATVRKRRKRRDGLIVSAQDIWWAFNCASRRGS